MNIRVARSARVTTTLHSASPARGLSANRLCEVGTREQLQQPRAARARTRRPRRLRLSSQKNARKQWWALNCTIRRCRRDGVFHFFVTRTRSIWSITAQGENEGARVGADQPTERHSIGAAEGA